MLASRWQHLIFPVTVSLQVAAPDLSRYVSLQMAAPGLSRYVGLQAAAHELSI